jgi:hypothetical protein
VAAKVKFNSITAKDLQGKHSGSGFLFELNKFKAERNF